MTGVRQQRCLIKNLIKVDLEGECGLRVHRLLPEQEQCLQEAVVTPIGPVNAEHAGGRIIARAERVDHLLAAGLVEEEDPQMR